MHLWRIVGGRPSWLDAVWVSGIFVFGYKIFFLGIKIVDFLEPKGPFYLILGYLIFLVMFLGSMGIYIAVFIGIQKRLAPAFRLPRWSWFVFAIIGIGILQPLIYDCTQAWSPAADQFDDARFDLFYNGSLVMAIFMLALCYALLVAFVERFPDLANRVSLYVLVALGILGLVAKFILAFKR